MKTTPITLEAVSNKSETDWYGNCKYYENPLKKYIDCKNFAECIVYESKNENCIGIEKIVVNTTKEFIDIMSWNDDLKYIKN